MCAEWRIYYLTRLPRCARNDSISRTQSAGDTFFKFHILKTISLNHLFTLSLTSNPPCRIRATPPQNHPQNLPILRGPMEGNLHRIHIALCSLYRSEYGHVITIKITTGDCSTVATPFLLVFPETVLMPFI